MSKEHYNKIKRNVYYISVIFSFLIPFFYFFTKHQTGLNYMLLFSTILISAAAIMVSEIIADISNKVYKTLYYQLLIEIPILMGIYFTNQIYFKTENLSKTIVLLCIYLILKYGFLAIIDWDRIKRNTFNKEKIKELENTIEKLKEQLSEQ